MEIRKLKSHEFEQAIKLSDEIFRDEDHVSMGQAFPQVFSKEFNQSFGAFDGEKLVSFIGLVPAVIKVGASELLVFSIGSVCTHQDYRNRGISSAILKEVYQYIDEAGASLLFVSGDRGLYLRNHCYHFGQTYRYVLNKESKYRGNYKGKIREGKPVDVFKVNRIKNMKNVAYKSSLWEWSTLFKAGGYTSIYKQKQHLFIAEDNGVVDGYVVIGLPYDVSSKRQSIVTEWGGEPEVVCAILANLLQQNITKELEIIIPWHEDFHGQMEDYFVSTQPHSGTVYLVNIQSFMEQIQPYLSHKNQKLAQDLQFKQIDSDQFKLSYHQHKEVFTRSELVELLFNVDAPSQTNGLETIFPIPLPSPLGLYYV